MFRRNPKHKASMQTRCSSLRVVRNQSFDMIISLTT